MALLFLLSRGYDAPAYESFRPPFSKGGAVEGAEPSSPVATGETAHTRFLFCELFSLPLADIKEKSG